MLQWCYFLGTPLSYPWQQRKYDDEVMMAVNCLSAHVGDLARSGAIAVDQFLDGDHLIAFLECPFAEGAVGYCDSSFIRLSLPPQ